MPIINLILIQLILVFIIDVSGFVDSVKLFISKYLTKSSIITSNYQLKPFDCSLCMMHWIGLLYILFMCPITYFIPYYALVCLLSLTTSNTGNLLFTMKDNLNKLIDKC